MTIKNKKFDICGNNFFTDKTKMVMQKLDYIGGKHQHRTNFSANAEPTFFEKNLLKLLLLAALAAMVWNGQVSLFVSFGEPNFAIDGHPGEKKETKGTGKAAKAALLSEVGDNHEPVKKRPGVRLPDGPAGTLTCAIDPNFAKRNGLDGSFVSEKNRLCLDYLEKYASVATAEMQKFGIPASIILAQGLLESDAGQSKLARTTNNHFGIKCFSKRCAKGHCANFTDDSHKDFFIKYPSAWGSFRAHSAFLKSSGRYSALFDLKKNDVEGWAHGLSRAGYATDKRYAEKLLAIIAAFDLTRFD